MLSLPDFKEKQILFIHTERGVPSTIRFLNDNIVFIKGGKIINRASCHKVFAVFVIGDIAITSGLMKDGLRHGVSFFFMRESFIMYASLNAAIEGHVVLRMRQYGMSELREFEMAKNLMKNKIENQIHLLKEKKMKEGLVPQEDYFFDQLNKVSELDSVRGLEGAASRAFFQEYFKSMNWHRRAPRAKEDPANLLLDIGYTMLFNVVDAILKLHGFDTYKGFYHKLFFQRKSLACDVMEPMRCLIDRELLKMHNLKRISEKDFLVKNTRFILPYENTGKYTEIFANTIMQNKEKIYSYVHDFYRHVLNEGDTPFPTFNLDK